MIKKLIDMNGRVSLITGSSGGLGRIFSETLAELGSDLILIDLPNNDDKKFRKYLMEKWNVKAHFIPCDLELEHQRNELIGEVKDLYSQLNVLINNAAFVGSSNLSGWAVPFEEQTIDTWRRALEVNLTAVFHLSQQFSPLIKKSIGGNIINIASIYGICGPDWSLYENTKMSNPAAYGASKGGVIQLTKWLSTTLAPEIRVNSISPGGIFREQPSQFVSKYNDKTPMNRMATEDDFRGIIAFIASDMSKYLTGQNIIVDGGFTT